MANEFSKTGDGGAPGAPPPSVPPPKGEGSKALLPPGEGLGRGKGTKPNHGNTNKARRPSNRWLWLIAVAALLALAVIAAMLRHPAVSVAKLGEWENVHDWRKLGKCIECHSGREQQRLAAGNPEGKLITPAKYHTEAFRRYTHGRSAGLQPQNCANCHERTVCNTCHARMPESHVLEFTSPEGDTQGAQAHALYGRERPSSCLICHKSFMTDCVACHSPRQLIETQERARKMLGPWAQLLEEAPK